jgi:hypothetical protein
MTAAQIGKLSPDAFAGLTSTQLSSLSADGCKGITYAQINRLPADRYMVISTQINWLSASAIAGLSEAALSNLLKQPSVVNVILNVGAVGSWTVAQFNALSDAALMGLTVDNWAIVGATDDGRSIINSRAPSYWAVCPAIIRSMSLDTIAGLSNQTLRVLFERDNISNIMLNVGGKGCWTTTQFQALGPAVNSFHPANWSDFARASRSAEAINGFSVDAIQYLSKATLTNLLNHSNLADVVLKVGAIGSWTAQQFGALSDDILCSLTDANWQSLIATPRTIGRSKEIVECLKDEAIAKFSSETVTTLLNLSKNWEAGKHRLLQFNLSAALTFHQKMSKIKWGEAISADILLNYSAVDIVRDLVVMQPNGEHDKIMSTLLLMKDGITQCVNEGSQETQLMVYLLGKCGVDRGNERNFGNLIWVALGNTGLRQYRHSVESSWLFAESDKYVEQVLGPIVKLDPIKLIAQNPFPVVKGSPYQARDGAIATLIAQFVIQENQNDRAILNDACDRLISELIGMSSLSLDQIISSADRQKLDLQDLAKLQKGLDDLKYTLNNLTKDAKDALSQAFRFFYTKYFLEDRATLKMAATDDASRSKMIGIILNSRAAYNAIFMAVPIANLINGTGNIEQGVSDILAGTRNILTAYRFTFLKNASSSKLGITFLRMGMDLYRTVFMSLQAQNSEDSMYAYSCIKAASFALNIPWDISSYVLQDSLGYYKKIKGIKDFAKDSILLDAENGVKKFRDIGRACFAAAFALEFAALGVLIASSADKIQGSKSEIETNFLIAELTQNILSFASFAAFAASNVLGMAVLALGTLPMAIVADINAALDAEQEKDPILKRIKGEFSGRIDIPSIIFNSIGDIFTLGFLGIVENDNNDKRREAIREVLADTAFLANQIQIKVNNDVAGKEKLLNQATKLANLFKKDHLTEVMISLSTIEIENIKSAPIVIQANIDTGTINGVTAKNVNFIANPLTSLTKTNPFIAIDVKAPMLMLNSEVPVDFQLNFAYSEYQPWDCLQSNPLGEIFIQQGVNSVYANYAALYPVFSSENGISARPTGNNLYYGNVYYISNGALDDLQIHDDKAITFVVEVSGNCSNAGVNGSTTYDISKLIDASSDISYTINLINAATKNVEVQSLVNDHIDARALNEAVVSCGGVRDSIIDIASGSTVFVKQNIKFGSTAAERDSLKINISDVSKYSAQNSYVNSDQANLDLSLTLYVDNLTSLLESGGNLSISSYNINPGNGTHSFTRFKLNDFELDLNLLENNNAAIFIKDKSSASASTDSLDGIAFASSASSLIWNMAVYGNLPESSALNMYKTLHMSGVSAISYMGNY